MIEAAIIIGILLIAMERKQSNAAGVGKYINPVTGNPTIAMTGKSPSALNGGVAPSSNVSDPVPTQAPAGAQYYPPSSPPVPPLPATGNPIQDNGSLAFSKQYVKPVVKPPTPRPGAAKPPVNTTANKKKALVK